MTKEQLKALLDAKKISQEVYDEMCKLIDAGKTFTEDDLESVVAKIEQAIDEKASLEKETTEHSEAEQFAKFKEELCGNDIIGKSITEDELKNIWEENNKDLKKSVIATINLWATKELSKTNSLGKKAEQFQNDPMLRQRVLDLQSKVLQALGVNTITLEHLPAKRILVDILMNDETFKFYDGKMNQVMDPFQYVEIGEGINRTKLLETFIEEDDGSIIPTSTQISNSKSANFSYNTEFKLTDTKYKTYISTTDGDYVKYFKSTADLVGFIQNTIAKCKRAISLFQYKLMLTAYNSVFKLLYAKGVSTAENPTNYRESTKTNMLDALADYKWLKEVITKQYQSTVYCIEDSNLPYVPSIGDFVYITSLESKINVEKFTKTALTGDANNSFAGDLIYIPDTYYDPLYRELAGLNVFTDADGGVHKNMILAIEKKAFVPMYNLRIDFSANFPFGLTQVIGGFFRGNIEIDKTAKCFLFEADALLSDFSVPVTSETVSKRLGKRK